MSNALVVLVDGFEEIEAITVIDVLRRGEVEVVVASLTSSLTLTGAHGIKITADTLFSAAIDASYDALILPGGPGTETLRGSEVLRERLHRQKEDGGLICAICAAPIVLCEAEVLESNQQVTCYPTCVMNLDRSSAGVPVVVDNNVITGQAPGASLLFALVVLQKIMGEKVASRVSRALVTDVL